jgi:UDP-glucuronate 4-epimerase
MAYIEALEKAIGRTAKKNFLPLQAGDVPATHANTDCLRDLTGFEPATPVEEGVRRFVDWFRIYYAK